MGDMADYVLGLGDSLDYYSNPVERRVECEKCGARNLVWYATEHGKYWLANPNTGQWHTCRGKTQPSVEVEYEIEACIEAIRDGLGGTIPKGGRSALRSLAFITQHIQTLTAERDALLTRIDNE